MSIGQKIKRARIMRNMKQSDLAQAVGVTRSAIGNYESGVSFPRDETIAKLMKELGVDANYLLMNHDQDPPHTTAPRIRQTMLVQNALDNATTPGNIRVTDKRISTERELIDGFRALPQFARTHVLSTIDILLSLSEQTPKTKEMRIFRDPAAAGRPLYAESDYDTLTFPAANLPDGADFGVHISGNSMSPGIPDLSVVWVHRQEDILSGQVGIFMLGDSAVCKRAHLAPGGALRALNSDNLAYAPITGQDLSGARCVGRVLGIMNPGDAS